MKQNMSISKLTKAILLKRKLEILNEIKKKYHANHIQSQFGPITLTIKTMHGRSNEMIFDKASQNMHCFEF